MRSMPGRGRVGREYPDPTCARFVTYTLKYPRALCLARISATRQALRTDPRVDAKCEDGAYRLDTHNVKMLRIHHPPNDPLDISPVLIDGQKSHSLPARNQRLREEGRQMGRGQCPRSKWLAARCRAFARSDRRCVHVGLPRREGHACKTVERLHQRRRRRPVAGSSKRSGTKWMAANSP